MPFVSDDFVTLPNGPTVPRDVVEFASDLYFRGLQLSVVGPDLDVRPSRLLTREDHDAIRRWKPYLVAIANYEPAMPVRLQ